MELPQILLAALDVVEVGWWTVVVATAAVGAKNCAASLWSPFCRWQEKLLSNGDRWENVLAKNIQADHLYR